jgi:hypothetical protein
MKKVLVEPLTMFGNEDLATIINHLKILCCDSTINYSTDRGIKKWFPGMLSKSFMNVGKMSLPKGTTLKEMHCKQI